MTHITVAHFPPFDTVTQPSPSVPRFSNPEHCTECSGLGCDACAFTGREYTPQQERESTPCVEHHANGWGSDGRCWDCGQEWPCEGYRMSHNVDTPERDVSQVCDTGGEMAEPEWDIMIRRASNGFVVRGWVENDYDNGVRFTDTLLEDGPTDDAGVRLMWEVIDKLGLGGGRRDAKRLRVVLQPGDKHHDYHPQPCAECECGCDPDQSTPEEGKP